jgi:hypothetical protein
MALKIRSILRGKRMADHTLEVQKFEGDFTNAQGVAKNHDDVVIMHPLIQMSRQGALVHAAWLVAIADTSENFEEFRGVLKAVLET